MAAHATWLTPPSEVWEQVFGKGTFPFGMAGKALKALYVAGHSPETIASHLAVYLEKNDPRYLNLMRFAQTFASWTPTDTDDDVLVDADGVLRST